MFRAGPLLSTHQLTIKCRKEARAANVLQVTRVRDSRSERESKFKAIEMENISVCWRRWERMTPEDGGWLKCRQRYIVSYRVREVIYPHTVLQYQHTRGKEGTIHTRTRPCCISKRLMPLPSLLYLQNVGTLSPQNALIISHFSVTLCNTKQNQHILIKYC